MESTNINVVQTKAFLKLYRVMMHPSNKGMHRTSLLKYLELYCNQYSDTTVLIIKYYKNHLNFLV